MQVANDPFNQVTLYDHRDENLPSEYKELAFKYYGEGNVDERDQKIKEFRQALEAEGICGPPHSFFYVILLRAGKFDLEASLKLLRSYIDMKKRYPEYFSVKPLPQAEYKRLFQDAFGVPLPCRDQMGRRILYIQLGRWQPDVLTCGDLIKSTTIIGASLAWEPKTQVAGVSVIINAANFGFYQLKNLSLQDLKAAAVGLQDLGLLWTHHVHVVSAPTPFIALYRLIRPLLRKPTQAKFKFHSNFESLHEYIDPCLLPTCLGGTNGPLNSDLSEFLTSSKERLEIMDALRTL